MPGETSQQPFAEDQLRNPADQELVSQVLGEQAAEEMEELTGKTETVKIDDAAPDKLELTGDEAITIEGKETNNLTPEMRRLQYIEWATDMKLDQSWVDNYFIFLPNGDVETVDGQFDLASKTVTSFPSSLRKINGDFVMSTSRWDISLNFLKEIEINGMVSIDMTMMDDFPRDVQCKRISVIFSKDYPEEQIEIKIKNLQKKGYTRISIIKNFL